MRVAVVGAGTGGLATAALLARAGHTVEIFERARDPGPVGAGLLLQPTGMAVLERLGVLAEARAGAARIERVHGTTLSGRRFMDLRYADLGPGAHGLGVHRGALFTALRGAAERAGATLHAGVEITARRGGMLDERKGSDPFCSSGPYDLIVGADGAGSTMRRFLGVRARVFEHRWGAVWAVFEDPDDTFAGTLDQYFDGARRMAGFLPTGRNAVSLFWSVRLDRIAGVRVDELRGELAALAPPAAPLVGRLETLLPASYRQVSLARWHDGELVLVGDAAHALSPQLGQGANLALMDAAALADALPDLAAYERARRPQANFYAFGARALNAVFQNDVNALALPRDLLMPAATRVPWARRKMLETLTGTAGLPSWRAWITANSAARDSASRR